MADFVAVIRRAVDGLAKNTPDMREKVYDKARGAVRRQLENMKPAPPESMIVRQMEKLEAAIVSVEAEHAEAVPAEVAVAEPAGFAAGSVAMSDQVQAREPAAAEVYEPDSAIAAQWPGESVEAPDTPAYAEEAYAPRQPEADLPETSVDASPSPQLKPPIYVDEPSGVAAAEDRQPLHGEAFYAAPADEGHFVGEDAPEPAAAPDVWAAQPEHYAHENDTAAHWPEDPGQEAPVEAPEPIGMWPSSDLQPAAVESDAAATDVDAHETVYDASPVSGAENTGQDWPRAPATANAAETDDWQWPESHEVPAPAEAGWEEVRAPELRVSEYETGSVASEAVEAHFDEQTYASASSVRMPSTEDFPVFGQDAADLPRAEEPVYQDLLSGTPHVEEHRGIQADQDLQGPQGTQATQGAQTADPWEDIENLIGYNPNALPAGGGANAADFDSDMDMPPPPVRPYRVAPKKRNYAAPILALIGLIILGAGGYALWMNRDALTEVVGLGGTAETPAPVAETPATEPAETAEAPSAEVPPAQPQQPQQEQAATPATPEPDPTSKFTQRLLADGKEVDEGPGPANGTGEGQSVAQLNAPPATPAEAPAAPAQAGGTEPTATPADAAALPGEKVFLYEERVGQTAPTAIEGAVSWSLQREADGGGPPQPVIQGRVNIPGRGLTALITVKRNTDASLPASHLIEVVFAVPPGFEGGAIDSVQRIAMKQTEQDRGDALIAVPAKITDDFHMIALNDFPDARATNLELLRSRNWMDVPLAYRNGRRALLTLQKGEEGTRVFAEAIREWQALSSSAPTGNAGQ